MSERPSLISKSFISFLSDAPEQAKTWNKMVQGLAEATALDEKTRVLAYLAVLAALGLESGVPFHVQAARGAGATLDEVISAILVGLPAAGHRVTQSLPTAIEAFHLE
jgi:alkylhydroperoxidase/carboxymuconolactone decarboxylase family protein YurZ